MPDTPMTLPEAEMAYKLAVARLEDAPEPETIEKELASLRAAADAGYAPAQYAYAYSLEFFTGNILGGVPYFIKAAQQGHTDALMELRGLYARKEQVRRLVGEVLTSGQVAALGLKKGNFFLTFCTAREGENAPLGLLIGLLFVGGIGMALLTRLIPALNAWLGGQAFTTDELAMLTVYTGVFFFCLMFATGIALEWHEAGSGSDHPLAYLVISLTAGYIVAALGLWGWYLFSHADRAEEQWWLGAGLCALAALFVGLFLIKCLLALCRALGRRAS